MVATLHEKTLAMKYLFFQIWCDDVIIHVTMSKKAFYLCMRTGIEPLESTSNISKGHAIYGAFRNGHVTSAVSQLRSYSSIFLLSEKSWGLAQGVYLFLAKS